MSNLSNAQLGKMANQEEAIRRQGLLNPDRGFVGNGFWWAGYQTYADKMSGYGGYQTAAQNDLVSPMGDTASVGGPEGVSAVGGMASN
jgi:hypothetical protein